jgi:hypothetical protein
VAIVLAIATFATGLILPLTIRDRTRTARTGGDVEVSGHDEIAAAQIARGA